MALFFFFYSFTTNIGGSILRLNIKYFQIHRKRHNMNGDILLEVKKKHIKVPLAQDNSWKYIIQQFFIKFTAELKDNFKASIS